MEQMEQGGTPPRNTKYRGWCLTVNNYSPSDVEIYKHSLSNTQYVIGKEIGTNGTRHLQICLKFTNPRTFNSIKKMFPRAHIEPCRNWPASVIYCKKDNDYITNIIEQLDTVQFLLTTEYTDVTWKPWQQQVLDICDSKPDSRSVNWFWEYDGNVGKSFLAKYIVLKYNAIIADGKKDNVFNQIKVWLEINKNKFPSVVLLDVPRYNLEYINYGTLEQIKNGMIYSGKYEGGTCLFPHPHIIVFANEKPDTSKLSKDRWNIVHISSS